MNSTRGFLIGLGAICIAAIVVMVLLFPGARFSFLLPAAFVCGSAVIAIYKNCKFNTPVGLAVVMVGFTLVVCGIILNINYFTVGSGGTYSHPVLHNNDSLTDWLRAMNRMYGEPVYRFEGLMGVRYYSFVIQGLMVVFGRDIGVPLIFNALCYSLTVILVGATTWQLTRNRSVTDISLVVATLMCYLMVQVTVLLKDVPLTMCVAALVYVIVRWRDEKRITLGELFILIPALIGTAFLRANFLLMLIVGLVLFGIRRRKFDIRFAALICATVLLFVVMHTFFHFPTVAENISASENSGVFVHPQKVHAWDNMLQDDYTAMPVWKKILWLPASVVVQFLIPFPWNFERDMIFGPTQAVAHFGYFWYYAGALLLFWIFACWKRSPRSMRLLVLWGIILTVATAYMTSGRVSRYCLVYLPMLIPAVAYTIRGDGFPKKIRRNMWIWLGIFTVILVPVLIVCHHLQMSAA